MISGSGASMISKPVSARVNICGNVLQNSLMLVLVEVFRKVIDFVKLQQLVNHVQQDVCFSRIARSTNEHPENVSGHAGVSLFAAVSSRTVGVIIWNFHSPYKIICTTITMSGNKRRQQTEEKGELYEQEEQIPPKFKTNKINKEFGQLPGEGL